MGLHGLEGFRLFRGIELELGLGLNLQPMIFGIVHFKHNHIGYPKSLLLAYLVQMYGCLGRRVKTP